MRIKTTLPVEIVEDPRTLRVKSGFITEEVIAYNLDLKKNIYEISVIISLDGKFLKKETFKKPAAEIDALKASIVDNSNFNKTGTELEKEYILEGLLILAIADNHFGQFANWEKDYSIIEDETPILPKGLE